MFFEVPYKIYLLINFSIKGMIACFYLITALHLCAEVILAGYVNASADAVLPQLCCCCFQTLRCCKLPRGDVIAPYRKRPVNKSRYHAHAVVGSGVS